MHSFNEYKLHFMNSDMVALFFVFDSITILTISKFCLVEHSDNIFDLFSLYNYELTHTHTKKNGKVFTLYVLFLYVGYLRINFAHHQLFNAAEFQSLCFLSSHEQLQIFRSIVIVCG